MTQNTAKTPRKSAILSATRQIICGTVLNFGLPKCGTEEDFLTKQRIIRAYFAQQVAKLNYFLLILHL